DAVGYETADGEIEIDAVGGGLWLGHVDEAFLRDVRVLGNDAEDGAGIAIYDGGHTDIGWSHLVDNEGDSISSEGSDSLRLVNTTIGATEDVPDGSRLDLEDGEVLLEHVTVLGSPDSEASVNWDGDPADFQVRASV